MECKLDIFILNTSNTFSEWKSTFNIRSSLAYISLPFEVYDLISAELNEFYESIGILQENMTSFLMT